MVQQTRSAAANCNGARATQRGSAGGGKTVRDAKGGATGNIKCARHRKTGPTISQGSAEHISHRTHIDYPLSIDVAGSINGLCAERRGAGQRPAVERTQCQGGGRERICSSWFVGDVDTQTGARSRRAHQRQGPTRRHAGTGFDVNPIVGRRAGSNAAAGDRNVATGTRNFGVGAGQIHTPLGARAIAAGAGQADVAADGLHGRSTLQNNAVTVKPSHADQYDRCSTQRADACWPIYIQTAIAYPCARDTGTTDRNISAAADQAASATDPSAIV